MNSITDTLSRFPTGLSFTHLCQRINAPCGIVRALLNSAVNHGTVRVVRKEHKATMYILNPAETGEE